MKLKRLCLCSLLCGSLALCQVSSSMAAIDGDDVLDIQEPAEAFLDETSLMSVNDDLADYIDLPPLYIVSNDLLPVYQYGNVISDVSGNNYVTFAFNPYILNNSGPFGGFDLICELSFSGGYDKSSIGVISSSSGITESLGYYLGVSTIPSSSNNSVVPSGFSYVDDNTIRISYFYSRSASIDNFMGIRLFPNDYLKHNTVKCKFYIRKNNSIVSEIGGGGEGGSGSGSGGGATT